MILIEYVIYSLLKDFVVVEKQVLFLGIFWNTFQQSVSRLKVNMYFLYL